MSISSSIDADDLQKKKEKKFAEFNGLVLMCKNTMVYDIMGEKILNKQLLPGMMLPSAPKEVFVTWMERRYSEKSNTIARQLRSYVFGQGNRRKINIETHALSLSDCYWLRQRNEQVRFEEISPYFVDFWKGTGYYTEQAVPTLYVNGVLPKYWESKELLVKSKELHEITCSQLAHDLGISVARVVKYEEGIGVYNFTNPNVMFESAEASGRIDPEDFTAEDVLDVFEDFGYDMLFFDALVGNGDRHAGNFGFLRDACTGEYLSSAPLFDFDHAFESKNANDVLIREVNNYKMKFLVRHKELVERAKNLNLSEYLQQRLESLE